MERIGIVCILVAAFWTLGIRGEVNRADGKADLQPAASGRFLDFGSLFNKYPNYNRPYYPGGGYNPGGGGYYPGSSGGGYYPGGGGGYYPNTGGYYPTAGGYPSGGYPNSGGYYPGGGGTNYLGGGYGGYGGYGGNGGFNSYLGYYDGDYQGRRNLGFGYYPHTNNLGLLRAGYSLPDYVSGYRGYN